jgi:hypothetical protein
MCIKKILVIVVFSLLFFVKGYSHPENMRLNGCHTDYFKSKFHCHQKKQDNFYKNYKHIKYEEKKSLINSFKLFKNHFLNDFKEN